MSRRVDLLTPQFVVMCAFTFTVFLSAFMLLPTAPYRIRELGGGTGAAGLFLGVLTYASALSAPLTGALADRFGRRTLLTICSLACAAFALTYWWLPSWQGLLAVAAVHGIFWSTLLSASSALLTDIVPAERRAEGLATWGLSTIAAIAVAPAVGFWALHRGWTWVCGLCLLCNLTTAVIPLGLPAQPTRERTERERLVEWRVLLVAGTLFLYSYGYGAITSFVAIHADERGIAPRTLFFTVFAGAIAATRLALAPLADRVGHRRVLLPCLVLVAAGMALVAASGSRATLCAAALVYGAGFGAAYPAFAALAVGRVPDSRRGAAFGAMLAAFDTGIGSGSGLTGWLAARWGLPVAFAVCAALSALALPYFLTVEQALPEPRRP